MSLEKTINGSVCIHPIYHNIHGLSNTRRKQLQENEMLRRVSLIGSDIIPLFVSALNSTIIFLF
jgi:hypothetical protein